MNAMIIALLVAQTLRPPIIVKDEGVLKGRASEINCTGAGVTCSITPGTPTMVLNATGGGAGATPGGSTGTVQINDGAGGFGAYAGSSCSTPNVGQTLSGTGALGCYQLKLNDLANPNGDKSFNMVDNHLSFNWVQPVSNPSFDGAIEFQASGNFSGDLVHIHQFTGNPGPGTHLLHIEGTDPDVIPLHIISGNTDAITTSQRISAGSFAGPLTGAVTGNADTATALSSSGSSGQFWAWDNTWQTPTGGSSAGPKVTGSNVTNTSTTSINITGLTWSVSSGVEYGFYCVISHLATTTSGVRFNVNGPAMTQFVAKFETSSSPSAAPTVLHVSAPSAGVQSATCTSSCNINVMTSRISGTFVPSAAGTVAIMVAPSTNGQVATVYRGSYCDVR